MDLNRLLDEAQTAAGVHSDYALAEVTEIKRQNLSFYRKGERIPDVYAATRLALLLHRDPLDLIAEIEASTEKNDKKREFWQHFLAHAKKGTAALILALAFGLTSLGAFAPQEAAAVAAAALSLSWVVRIMYELRQKPILSI